MRWRRAPFTILLLVLGCGQRPVPEHPECAPCPACSEVSAQSVAPEPETDPADDGENEGAGGALVSVGECDTSWLPPGLVSDVDAAATAQLAELVRGWIADTGGPALEVVRGVVYAKSEDDTGADPPYPSFVGRDAALACGAMRCGCGNTYGASF